MVTLTPGFSVLSPDHDLERRVRVYLTGRHVSGLRQIAVRARNGTVTLQGQVDSFYQKQLCLTCCRHVAGVITLVDEVEVAES